MEKMRNNAGQCCILLILMLLQGIPTLFAHFSCRSSCILRGGLTALKNRDLQGENAVATLLSQGFPPL